MSKLLDNKVALVTGAGSGIGREIAYAFAREGARVAISDISEAGGMETYARVRERGGKAVFYRADTSKPGDNEMLVRIAMKELGGLHVAVNNAGIGGPSAPVGEYPVEGWDRVLAINLSGVFYGMRYQIPAMLKTAIMAAATSGVSPGSPPPTATTASAPASRSPAPPAGSIINIASILSQVGFRGSSAYVAAKHGVVGLTKNAALEYGARNLRVNAVGPGFIKTPMVEKNLPREAMLTLAQLHPLGRLGEAGEVAELVTWLASDRASFITGSYYAIDGGYLAQ